MGRAGVSLDSVFSDVLVSRCIALPPHHSASNHAPTMTTSRMFQVSGWREICHACLQGCARVPGRQTTSLNDGICGSTLLPGIQHTTVSLHISMVAMSCSSLRGKSVAHVLNVIAPAASGSQ